MDFDHIEMQQHNTKPDDVANAEVALRCYNLVNVIGKELQQLPPITAECSIYRVSRRLLNIHPKAYEPRVLSIGPFHHGRQDLKAMERFKLQFLRSYLSRANEGIQGVARAALTWETKARNCYEDLAMNMNNDHFVKMMLVDGCFVVEFLVTVYALIFRAMNIHLYHDLIMLENQLPFFVLQGLFNIISPTNRVTLVEVVEKFFANIFMKDHKIPRNISHGNIKHLIDFLGFYYAIPSTSLASNNIQPQNKWLLLPPPTTELCDAGIVLEKATSANNIMDISFEGGVLKIPPFEIHDLFEISMGNLMAFENFQVGNHIQSYATHYVLFLGALISTEKDSSLLVKKGIVTNLIGGSDEEVSNLFNDIGKDVVIQGDFYYKDISMDLHEHCKARWNRWMASLRRDYFNTPWAFISFIAATVIIVLTLLRTIFSGVLHHN